MELIERYLRVRARSEALAAPLSAEDQQVQSMPSCSPTKWHRAHTTWFFETFVLTPHGVPPVDARWSELFNSYYQAVGPRHPRPRRGLLSRPGVAEIAAYRATVDGRLCELLAAADPAQRAALTPLVELGLAHEEQHQELLLTDALHALAQSPLSPAYRGPAPAASTAAPAPLRFTDFDGGLIDQGASADAGFHFDNEQPRHRAWLAPFAIADRPVTVAEVRAFADDGGYRAPALWLSDGWEQVQAEGLDAPAYVVRADGAWLGFGLDGVRALAPAEPAAFLSYYEADAIARWLGARLPTEAEWEHAATGRPVVGNLLDDARPPGALRPLPGAGAALDQLYGDVWEWTRSSYEPYPGYAPATGALGEYNGKFMINQRVLRGGSCFTPPGHLRATYRNFWHPDTRFQVTGLRLARDA
ncbi:MAG: ergothioneine biosynthesis protein EgtB [Myxococcales bacterium]|nr:ergothioneine biosynthesis protein EgtB [Myxococcales bacterium]